MKKSARTCVMKTRKVASRCYALVLMVVCPAAPPNVASQCVFSVFFPFFYLFLFYYFFPDPCLWLVNKQDQQIQNNFPSLSTGFKSSHLLNSCSPCYLVNSTVIRPLIYFVLYHLNFVILSSMRVQNAYASLLCVWYMQVRPFLVFSVQTLTFSRAQKSTTVHVFCITQNAQRTPRVSEKQKKTHRLPHVQYPCSACQSRYQHLVSYLMPQSVRKFVNLVTNEFEPGSNFVF